MHHNLLTLTKKQGKTGLLKDLPTVKLSTALCYVAIHHQNLYIEPVKSGIGYLIALYYRSTRIYELQALCIRQSLFSLFLVSRHRPHHFLGCLTKF